MWHCINSLEHIIFWYWNMKSSFFSFWSSSYFVEKSKQITMAAFKWIPPWNKLIASNIFFVFVFHIFLNLAFFIARRCRMENKKKQKDGRRRRKKHLKINRIASIYKSHFLDNFQGRNTLETQISCVLQV